ncbi:MAG TPA: hypothetical protein VMS40_27075 [Vicinamibacterales bacterium]|nr:hypothetical protein [Vicinamibacterales bacterium]
MVGGNGGDCAARAAGNGQGAAHFGEPSAHGAALGAHAAYGVERIAQAALADRGDLTELCDRDRLADLCAQERLGPLDDLPP